MEGRKTYLIELTRIELEGIICGLDVYKFNNDDNTFQSLREELLEKLKETKNGLS